MKNTLRQVFHSGKFVVGFTIFVSILLTIFVYPLINPGDPLEMIGLETFAKPGTYVSVYDTVDAESTIFKLDDADEKRLYGALKDADRVSMVQWLTEFGIAQDQIDMNDTEGLLRLWQENYDSSVKLAGMTKSLRNYYQRLDSNLDGVANGLEKKLATNNEESGQLEEVKKIKDYDYVNVKDVANVKVLPLGTDNFGRDMFKELVAAIKTSVMIGVIAGLIATFIGLTLGLFAGFIGGLLDDIIMFVTNIFTVIPSFVILILITSSISQEMRGAATVAVVIGATSWVWTARSVRSQVISLRNRDHVNLSKLSGHSLLRIVLQDILPYIASYVVMAFILQITIGILAEAQLSMLGLGPKTTEIPTLGMMMQWSMLYSAHLNGSWWAYAPVVLSIALISFSLNLMNTGLDQVFNPTLRD